MLSLLLGTRTRTNKCCIHKVSKEWYYDHNVWKVVLHYGIENTVRLPYAVRRTFKTPNGCNCVLSSGNKVMYIRGYKSELCNLDGTPAPIIPDALYIRNASWITDNRLMCNTAAGDMVVYQFDKRAVTTIEKRKYTFDVTVRDNTSIWINSGTLHISDESFKQEPITQYVGPFCNSQIHCTAIDSKGLIYVGIQSYISVHSKTSLLYLIQVNKIVIYILIHGDILHVACADKCVRAYTLEGKCISTIRLKNQPISMCVTNSGELIIVDEYEVTVV
jgi:hypothetical protein